MLIIREIFTAKPGQAGKLARLFKKAFQNQPESMKTRVMTDAVGPYNTVIMEYEVESLAEWEKQMNEMRSGKPDPYMTPEVAEEMSKYTEMYTHGKREIFRVE